MNYFSADPFLDALAAARFARRTCEPALVSAGGQVFRVLSVDGMAVTQVPFLDLLEPVPDADSANVRPLGWVPVALRSVETVDAWNQAGGPPECEPCPYVSWAHYAATWEQAAKRLPNAADTRRKRRKLEAEVGPVRYVGDDPDPAALRQALEWKSQQYRATGVVDQFADPRNVALFQHLHGAGALVVSSLYADERLAAVHVGMLLDGRFYSWIPAYDAELQRYSPGRLLQHDMMEESYRRGDREFDFLIGDEDYKFHYATHVRVAGPVGTPPLTVRARKAAKGAARAALHHTRLLEGAKSLRRWLRGRAEARAAQRRG